MSASSAASSLKLVEENKCFGGVVRKYQHTSTTCHCTMRFSVFLPPQALSGACDVPGVYYLAGLTCTEDTFLFKSGAELHAARLGLALICPDTSPRGEEVKMPLPPDAACTWDFGLGAGFYLDATHPDYAHHFNMYSYVTQELPEIIHRVAHLPIDADRVGIMGHSMGGHGALIAALKNPGIYRSVSAFAPICHPTKCTWGKKAFAGYLADPITESKAWDAVELLARYTSGPELSILIDQGSADTFLKDGQLLPQALVDAAANTKHAAAEVMLRYQEGYGHGYWFVKTFVGEHLEHHARYLLAEMDVEAGADSVVGVDPVTGRRDTLTM